MNLVFLGPPGAGKGTQAATVSAALGIVHISTGAMFRRAMCEGTPTGIKAKSFIDAGQLVPDSVVIEMVAERLAEPDCAGGYLLDGFPRTMDQARALDTISSLDVVVDIAVEDEKLIARLSGRRLCPACGRTFHASRLSDPTICPDCGEALIRRADDNPETILNRLNVYHAQTSPLTDYYALKRILVRVDGSKPVEQVTGAILTALKAEL